MEPRCGTSEKPERLRVEPLCGTGELLRVEPSCGTLRILVPGFGRLPQTTPKLYWKNPKLFKLLGNKTKGSRFKLFWDRKPWERCWEIFGSERVAIWDSALCWVLRGGSSRGPHDLPKTKPNIQTLCNLRELANGRLPLGRKSATQFIPKTKPKGLQKRSPQTSLRLRAQPVFL